MALKSANQQGNTLIEFMVAALVGAMALAIVGTVFLSNQKAAAQRSKEIMLLQQVSSVMQQMKRISSVLVLTMWVTNLCGYLVLSV